MNRKKKLLMGLCLTIALMASAGSMSAHAEGVGEATAIEPIGMFSQPYSGISLHTTDYSQYFPTLKEGNHVRWIDRIEVPEYASALYPLLEEGCDNDGIDDFLIDADSSDLVENLTEYAVDATNGTTVKGIKLADIRGTGSSFDEASTAVYDDFYDKFYKIRSVFEAFDRDHSEVFWLDGGCYITTVNFKSSSEYNEATKSWTCIWTGEVYFVLESEGYDWDIWNIQYNTPEKIRAAIQRVDEKAEEIISGANSSTAIEYVNYFNDWLSKNNEYNYYVGHGTMDIMEVLAQYPDVFECTGALLGNVGNTGPVCESYARAMKVLCDKTGIPCVLVDGYALNSDDAERESHMWNYVQIDGKWYAVDVTWNDPLWGNEGAVSGNERTDYLLIGAQTKTQIGYSMMPFIQSHPAQNCPYGEGEGVAFTNGPILNESAYDPSTASETCTHETLEIYHAADVDCVTEGYTGDSYCAECGLRIKLGTSIPATGHHTVSVKTAATLNMDGKMEEVCDSCGSILSAAVIKCPEKITLSTTQYAYNGKSRTPTITVKDRSGQIISSDNYTVTYPEESKKVGTYKVTITFHDDYSGTITKTFDITPAKTSISKLVKGKKSFTVKWAKKKAEVTGYQIQYCVNSNFKNAKTKVIAGAKTKSKKITKLKAKKKYYVRIRTYKTVNGVKYYSDWSKAKTIKTK